MEFLQGRKSCFCPECFIEEMCYKRSYCRRFRQHGRNSEYGNDRYQRGIWKINKEKRVSKDGGLWRPWIESEEQKNKNNAVEWNSYEKSGLAIQSPPQFQHPIKLIWPKKPFDYMYAEGEKLLRDFPIQATLEFAPDADSESDDDDDFDDDCGTNEKEDSKKTVCDSR